MPNASTSLAASRGTSMARAIAACPMAGKPAICRGSSNERAHTRLLGDCNGGIEQRFQAQRAMGAGAWSAAGGVWRGHLPVLAEAAQSCRQARARPARVGAVALHARLGRHPLCRPPEGLVEFGES